MAVQLKGFWQWGAGGEITKVIVQQTDDVVNEHTRKQLIEEINTHMKNISTTELKKLRNKL